MPAQAILDDLRTDGIVPSLTPDGRGIALPAGRLNPAQRAAIAANRPALLAHLLAQAGRTSPPPAPPPPPPLPWLHMDQPWRAADRLYEQHHWQCATCRAAARGHADRCPEGQSLRSRCATQVQAALLQRAP